MNVMNYADMALVSGGISGNDPLLGLGNGDAHDIENAEQMEANYAIGGINFVYGLISGIVDAL